MTLHSTLNSEPVQPNMQREQTLPAYSVQPETPRPTPSQDENEKPQPEFSPSNSAFQKMSSMAGRPLNKAANFIGAEGWWPAAMEKECNKAARILHSFTKLSSPVTKANGPMHPTGLTRKSMVKIPPAVLQNAAGLAIFNVLRAGGGHASLAGGSGVVISRRPDGTWSPPSAFVVTIIGGGFVFGLDVYDCVCVLNTPEQVNTFTRPRLSLGAEGSVALGPIGTGSSVETALSKTVKPMWTYMKSRGFWAGVQIDGTIIVSRSDANAAFYNKAGITPQQILNGEVAWPTSGNALLEVLTTLQGQSDYERAVINDLAGIPASGDTGVSEPYTDVPRDAGVQDREAQKDNEATPNESGLPTYKAVKESNKDEKVESAMDEKERLSKSGY